MTESTTAHKPFDGREFRDVLGHFPTGVAVITAIGTDGQPCGMAVGSFTSVSLDPPLVAFLPARSSTTFPLIRDAPSFCVNVLTAEQESLCRLFASRGVDKFRDLSWTPAPSGAPVVDGASAWIDCTTEVIHDAGDHLIVVGRVHALAAEHPSPPLVFFRGGYGQFLPSSLVAAPEYDIVEQVRIAGRARPLMEALAAELELECFATGVSHDELVLLASAEAPRGRYSTAPVGGRTPLKAPVGGVFIAWAKGSLTESWLRTVAHRDHESALTALTRIRDRGWSVSLGDDVYDELEAAVGTIIRTGSEELLDRPVDSIISSLSIAQFEHALSDPTTSHDVRMLNAPVFDADSNVAMALGVRGFRRRITPAEVASTADRLVETANKLTRRLGGSAPEVQ